VSDASDSTFADRRMYNFFGDKSFAAASSWVWNNLAYDRTLATDDSTGDWKHFCL